MELAEHWGEGRVVDLFAPSVANRVQRRFWATFERAAASPSMARALLDAVFRIDVTPILPSVAVPTLILHRTGDVIPITNARLMAARIPGARLVELPGDDHAFWFGDFEQIVDEAEAFLTGARSAAEPDRRLATVLFTDMVGSTERAAALGDRGWRDVLERHDAVVREHVEAFRGRVVKSLGDGSLSLFDGPARAIRAAEEVREALSAMDVPVRAGVHTGECEVMGDDVGGMAVHIGARIAALAGPGEILVVQHRGRPGRRLRAGLPPARDAHAQGRARGVAAARGRRRRATRGSTGRSNPPGTRCAGPTAWPWRSPSGCRARCAPRRG